MEVSGSPTEKAILSWGVKVNSLTIYIPFATSQVNLFCKTNESDGYVSS